MKIIKSICKVIDTINDWIGRVVAFSVLIVLAVILMEVVMRRFFNNSQVWSMDAITMTSGAYVILIAGYGFLKKAYVSVDLLFERLPKIGQHIMHLITYCIYFVPFAFLSLSPAYNLFYKAYLSGERAYSIWQPALWPIRLAFFIGLVLLALQGISEILKLIDAIIECIRAKKGTSGKPVSES